MSRLSRRVVVTGSLIVALLIAVASVLGYAVVRGTKGVSSRQSGSPDVSFFLNSLKPSDLAEVQRGPESLGREESALRQMGVPVGPEELRRAMKSVPAQQNAAADYEKLGALFKKAPDLDVPHIGAGEDYSPAIIQQTAKMLREHPDALILIHRAASRPSCVFDWKWEQGPAMLTPEFATMRRAVRILSLESFLLAKDGRYADAVRTQSLEFTVANQAASEPTLIAEMVGSACNQMATEGMQRILRIAGPNAIVDREAADAVTRYRSHFDLVRAMWGEVNTCIVIRNMLVKDPLHVLSLIGNTPPGQPAPAPLPEKARAITIKWIDASVARVLRGYRQIISAAGKKTYAERVAAARGFGAEWGSASDDYRQVPDALTLLAAILLPTTDGIWDTQARSQASAQITIAGARVLAYKAGHGILPTTLEQVSPDTVDPFNDKPFRYRQEGSGFVIYSVGGDGKFDGTPVKGPDGKDQKTALYFRYVGGGK